MFATCMLHDDSLLNEIATETMLDPFAKDIMARINDPSPDIKSSYLNPFTTWDGLLKDHVLHGYYKIVMMILLPATLGS